MKYEGIWIPTLLSVIAGMVDLTGFLTLGNLFTAHITGNLVVIAALVARGGRINPGQVLAIPIFMTAVVMTWLIARASGRRGPGLMRLLLLFQFLLVKYLQSLAQSIVLPLGRRCRNSDLQFIGDDFGWRTKSRR